jgi:hypothetical protein
MGRGAWGGEWRAARKTRGIGILANEEAGATFSCSCGAGQKQGDVGMSHFLRLFAAIPSAGLLLYGAIPRRENRDRTGGRHGGRRWPLGKHRDPPV